MLNEQISQEDRLHRREQFSNLVQILRCEILETKKNAFQKIDDLIELQNDQHNICNLFKFYNNN